ncbi:hypothetical protein M422DRAFT_232756 [Sphaerobolus stellatus SS14]|uniref:TAP42-like protein n=2 Tax=Sphaerobolus stellatus (strain SS14) TaxID=990650 RepID=A0A0C9VE46_SPHS4|nr:hypothetical protein M422DRAFT_232756 [Sphaerobolus stellatus SS14]
MASESNISLRGLFINALQDASRTSKMSTIEDETQELVVSSLANLKKVAQGVELAGVFSPNETLEDLSTAHLPFLLVDYVLAEMEGRMRTVDGPERMKSLTNSQRHLHAFLRRLRQYDVVPEEEKKAFSKKASEVRDPTARRELKIKQYKTEKEIRSRLEVIGERRGQTGDPNGFNDDLELVASMLLATSADEQQRDDEDDETLRETYLLALRLMWVQAQTLLENMDLELELLRNAPPPAPQRPESEQDTDNTWRLDPSIPRGGPDGKGPLMDSSGRILRPFTILPGVASSERARFQGEVFRPDHRLPSMSIDEYLEEENRRGNIITGGGPDSLNKPTTSEQLQLDSEMDGMLQGELKEEEKRQKDETWAQYTDLHPKGEGNTMNTG